MYWATRWAERLRCNWRCRGPSGSISWWSQMLHLSLIEGNQCHHRRAEGGGSQGVSRADAEAIFNDAIEDPGGGYLLMG